MPGWPISCCWFAPPVAVYSFHCWHCFQVDAIYRDARKPVTVERWRCPKCLVVHKADCTSSGFLPFSDLVTWINGPGREEGLLPHELAEVVERHCPFLHELIDSGRWRNDQELRQACAPLLSHIADVIIKPYRGASGMLY